MLIPDNLIYTREHEWAREEGDSAIWVGLTDYAQEQLGDIVYVELPSVGDELTKEEPLGVIESVKTVSDIYAPVSGVVVVVNDLLEDSPEILNEDPYKEGWLVKIEMSDPSDLDDLMTPEEYAEYIEEESH